MHQARNVYNATVLPIISISISLFFQSKNRIALHQYYTLPREWRAVQWARISRRRFHADLTSFRFRFLTQSRCKINRVPLKNQWLICPCDGERLGQACTLIPYPFSVYIVWLNFVTFVAALGFCCVQSWLLLCTFWTLNAVVSCRDCFPKSRQGVLYIIIWN